MCATYAESVYRREQPAQADVLRMQIVEFEQDHGAAYLLPGQIIIAVAGSAVPAHWLSNFKIVKKDCFGWLRAHKGFSECAEGMLDAVLRTIDGWPARHITLTGHSRGGAIAVLLAAAVEHHTGCPVDLVTFAQPRVSTESTLRSALHGDYLRVVNGSDAVPRAPRLGYSHAGRVLYLANDGQQVNNPGAWQKFRDRTFRLGQHERATDHSMRDYLRQLRAGAAAR